MMKLHDFLILDLYKKFIMESAAKKKKKKSKKDWISKAIEKPGSLKALAAKEGAIKDDGTIDVEWLKNKAKSKNPKTAKRARLALTLRKLKKG